MPRRPQVLLIVSSSDSHWPEMMRHALSRVGYVEVEGPENAIDLIVESNFDMVILDSLAVKDVPLMVGRIRAQRPGTAVIVVSALPDWAKARRAFHAGAADYVRKSFDPDEIVRTVCSVLGRRVN